MFYVAITSTFMVYLPVIELVNFSKELVQVLKLRRKKTSSEKIKLLRSRPCDLGEPEWRALKGSLVQVPGGICSFPVPPSA